MEDRLLVVSELSPIAHVHDTIPCSSSGGGGGGSLEGGKMCPCTKKCAQAIYSLSLSLTLWHDTNDSQSLALPSLSLSPLSAHAEAASATAAASRYSCGLYQSLRDNARRRVRSRIHLLFISVARRDVIAS